MGHRLGTCGTRSFQFLLESSAKATRKARVNVVAQGIWEGHAEVTRVILENSADVGAKDKLL